jgi:N-acetylglucosaminyl-diphospho-decaprenol L-rhamnosyltransferase
VARIDVVVVSYNSRDRLRACVEPLAGLPSVRVIVADNASPDGSLAAVADLPVTRLELGRNGGFSFGCNAGWRTGDAPHVLFLNPDASIDSVSLDLLARKLDEDESVAAAAPKIVDHDGSLHYSLRRFPQLRSTYARALFLHRAFPRAPWTDEVVRDAEAYERSGSPDWVSGACVLVRRSALELLGGFDEGFFLYCEDTDLCQRLRDAGYDIRYEPAALCVHEGGASAPLSTTLPILAASRIRYARKHRGHLTALLERGGVALTALLRVAVAEGGRAARVGHARSLITRRSPV